MEIKPGEQTIVDLQAQRDHDIEMTRKCFLATQEGIDVLRGAVLRVAGELLALTARVEELEGKYKQ